MNGFMKGMLFGVAAGIAAEMALRTTQGKKTTAGRAMQTATDVVDSAVTSVQHTMGK